MSRRARAIRILFVVFFALIWFVGGAKVAEYSKLVGEWFGYSVIAFLCVLFLYYFLYFFPERLGIEALKLPDIQRDFILACSLAVAVSCLSVAFGELMKGI